MLEHSKIEKMTDEELLQEHNFYKEQLCLTMSSGRTSFCVQSLVQIEAELDSRNIDHSKFAFWDFGDADWFKKLENSSEQIDHIIIDPKGGTELIGYLIRSSLQNGRDPSSIMLFLPNGDALQLNDLDDEKAIEVLNAMFGLEMTVEEYGSEGKYAKYFNKQPSVIHGFNGIPLDEAHELFMDDMTSRTRKYNPKIQLKTANPPFYRQLEKKKWY